MSWDELQWLKGIQADTSVMEGCGDQRGGPTNKKRDHMRNLGICEHGAYRDAHNALKAAPAYIKRKKSKPKARAQFKEWLTKRRR